MDHLPQALEADRPPVDLQPVDSILDELSAGQPVDGRASRDALIPLLQKIQSAYGYLPAEVLIRVSERTRIPLSSMYGVITFYSQFYLEPHGKNMVRCCRGTACHVRGGKKVIQAVRGVLGVEDGETTPDMLFSFETVACLGACALSPVMVVNSTYYGKMTPRRAEQILRQAQKEEQG